MTNYLERKEEILAKVKSWGTPYGDIVATVTKIPGGKNVFDTEAGILEQIDKCVPPEKGGNTIFYMERFLDRDSVLIHKAIIVLNKDGL